jgi:hypothetical protein
VPEGSSPSKKRKAPDVLYQLRTYTLPTADALEKYATARWPKHIPSLRKFGVSTHGLWTDRDADAHRLVALVSSEDGADPTEVTEAFLASPECAATMEGFSQNIIGV